MIKSMEYNEIEYASKIFKNGFQSNYYKFELKLLVIYLRDYKNKSKKECKECIIEFCKKYYPEYTYALCYKLIKNSLQVYNDKSTVLIQIDQIPIYEDEYDAIVKLGLNDSLTLVLFAILVKKKLSKKIYKIKNGETSKSKYMQLNQKCLSDLKIMSNKKSKKELLTSLSILNKMNIISMGNNAVIDLNFIIDSNEKEKIISIKNYENTYLYIQRYWGYDKIKNCMYCNEPYLSKSNRQMFCKKHSVSKLNTDKK